LEDLLVVIKLLNSIIILIILKIFPLIKKEEFRKSSKQNLVLNNKTGPSIFLLLPFGVN